MAVEREENHGEKVDGSTVMMRVVSLEMMVKRKVMKVKSIRGRLGERQHFGELALWKLPNHRLDRGVRKLSGLVRNYF